MSQPRKAKPRSVTYATGSFDLAAGHAKAVAVKLSRAGKRLAHAHKRLKVWINITLTGTSPMVLSRAMTLRF